jgi:hypothetical protein
MKPEFIELDSGENFIDDYFIDKDGMAVTKMCCQKHLNAIPYLLRINNTGVCGTIEVKKDVTVREER